MHRFFDVLMLALVVVIFLLMFRPGSLAPSIVGSVGNTTLGVFQTLSGGGTWGSK